jgi:tight adherence protein B
MTIRFGASLLIAAAPLVQTQRLDQVPAFRSRVDVVRLDVSVVRNGVPVRGLTAADFVVTDNGAPQIVESVEVDQLPLSVQLVLDTSGSVSGARLTHLIAAADGVVAALRPGEYAGLLTFSHRLRPLAPITEDLASVRAALADITADGRTALRDAVQLALATDHAATARPLTLVFTDGVDNTSWLSDEEVLESARRAGTVIHAVGVDAQQISPTRFVEKLVEAAGGRQWSARSESDLARLFTSALDEMRARYLLSFSPSRPLRPGWHALRVRLKNGGGDITARTGYFVSP